ncbi:MAG: hypothetical protein ACK53Y_21375, partial [bacterium]
FDTGFVSFGDVSNGRVYEDSPFDTHQSPGLEKKWKRRKTGKPRALGEAFRQSKSWRSLSRSSADSGNRRWWNSRRQSVNTRTSGESVE